MHSRPKNIISFFLLGILLFSNLGLTANTLYCLCKGEEQVSFFEIEDDCEQLFTEAKKSSCCSKGICEQVNPENDKHQCTKKGKKFVKLNTNFLFNKSEQLPDFSWEVANIPPEFFQRIEVKAKTKTKLPNKAPPSIWTRKIYLSYLQTFLC